MYMYVVKETPVGENGNSILGLVAKMKETAANG